MVVRPDKRVVVGIDNQQRNVYFVQVLSTAVVIHEVFESGVAVELSKQNH